MYGVTLAILYTVIRATGVDDTEAHLLQRSVTPDLQSLPKAFFDSIRLTK